MVSITSWLKTCFGFKKKDKENEENSMISNSNSGNGRIINERLRRETSSTTTPSLTAEQCKQAIAMVVATVAAAETVIASADAAIAMYRRLISESRVTPAAIKIQSFYRGHLARRARRALKSLVRIQALFRGYMVRKRMQAFMRAKEYYVHANRTYDSACQPERSKQRLSRSTSSNSRLVAQHSRSQLLSSECQCPHGFLKSRDREFHVASLPYTSDSKLMSDCAPTSVFHSEVSMKEDEKHKSMKMAKGIKRHKHSLRQPSEGWSSTVNKLGFHCRGKDVGSIQDGSTRPLNQYEKISVRRDTPRQRRRILPLF